VAKGIDKPGFDLYIIKVVCERRKATGCQKIPWIFW